MFSNLSATWRRRLRAAVAVWAVLLVASAFAASRATVPEQVDAAAARAVMDATLGEAAGSLSGAAVLAAGPLESEPCSITPARPGLSLSRTVQISGATVDQVEALAERFSLRSLQRAEDAKEAVWSGTTATFVSLRITTVGADPAGGRWSEPVVLRATTGCRPLEGQVASFAPEPPFEADATWAYGSVPCPGGEILSSWTAAVEAAPFRVLETSGTCA